MAGADVQAVAGGKVTTSGSMQSNGGIAIQAGTDFANHANLSAQSDVALVAGGSFHQGQDENASAFLDQARKLRPEDQQVLRVALFFAAAFGENEEAKDLCRRLLSMYPDDEWARVMGDKLGEGGRILNLDLPPLKIDWEAVLDRKA